jgi:hypothetical protein
VQQAIVWNFCIQLSAIAFTIGLGPVTRGDISYAMVLDDLLVMIVTIQINWNVVTLQNII